MSRLAAVALGAVILLAGIFGLTLLFNARDDAGVDRAGGPGMLEAAGARTGGGPPTSGAAGPDLVPRDARELTDAQVLRALELGDVVLAYPGARPPGALRTLQEEVAGPFDPELAAAGQAVVLARVPGIEGVQALAWRHRLQAGSPGDPALRSFAEYWLGRGARAAR